MTAIRPDAPLTEARLQALVIELCGHLNLRVYHTYDSRRSQPGFPDLVIVGSKVLYRELKSAGGIVSKAQTAWLDDLTDAGADASVWWPKDWPDWIHGELRAIRRRP